MFTDKNISIAIETDIPQLVSLLNSAYRGEESKKGWTSEAYLIAGEVRSDEASVKEVMQRNNSVMLKYSDEEKGLIGCVNLQQHGKKVYLGMFSVSPLMQGGGVGKKLLTASEEYTKRIGCSCIYMTVITAREELINWYKRHGYVDTGGRKPFEEDGVSGKHLQQLEFMILQKIL